MEIDNAEFQDRLSGKRDVFQNGFGKFFMFFGKIPKYTKMDIT